MKPVMIAVASAMLSAPVFHPHPFTTRSPVAPDRIEATNLGRLVWLAKADEATALRRTHFTFAPQERGLRVKADPAALRAGLALLMSESARSMSGRPLRRMGVRLFSSEGRVTLELKDAGPGLDVADLVAMYGRGSSGLSNARRRIEKAGGVVNVSSAVGAGTVFLIEFPKS